MSGATTFARAGVRRLAAFLLCTGAAFACTARAGDLGIVIGGRMSTGSTLQNTLHMAVQSHLMDSRPGDRLLVVTVPGRAPGTVRPIIDLRVDSRPAAHSLQEIRSHNAMLTMASTPVPEAPETSRVTTGGIVDALVMASRRLDQQAHLLIVGPLGRLPPPTEAMLTQIRPGARVRLLAPGDPSAATPDQRANISAWREMLRSAGLSPWRQ